MPPRIFADGRPRALVRPLGLVRGGQSQFLVGSIAGGAPAPVLADGIRRRTGFVGERDSLKQCGERDSVKGVLQLFFLLQVHHA
jgi:hypothetical protein